MLQYSVIFNCSSAQSFLIATMPSHSSLLQCLSIHRWYSAQSFLAIVNSVILLQCSVILDRWCATPSRWLQCSTIFCYSELRHFATVLIHYIILSAILDRGCSFICTESRVDETAHTGDRWVSARARGCMGSGARARNRLARSKCAWLIQIIDLWVHHLL
jgi:hypothetical protein